MMENKAKEPMDNSVECIPKKVRGRPLGSVGKVKKLKALALGGGEKAITTFRHEFKPVVVVVEPGEDLVEKVFSLGNKNGPYVCIFTATGSISKAHMIDDTSGKIVKYEGIFEILYVKGSNASPFHMHIASEEGIVHKGNVCGPVFAAGRIQVVAATFLGKGTKRKDNAKNLSEPQYGPQEHYPIEPNSDLPEFLCESQEQCHIEANSDLPEFLCGPQEQCQIEANSERLEFQCEPQQQCQIETNSGLSEFMCEPQEQFQIETNSELSEFYCGPQE